MPSSDEQEARGPLSGIRVVDFTENMAGPFGTMILGDQGADVVKVEALRGDAIRHAGTGSKRMGAYFANLNRNKRSMSIDLRRPEGQEVLERLLDTADVVVHSFRPAAAERLGIDAARVRTARPRVIHATIVGFGTAGPLAGMAVYDHVIQAMSGMAALQADGPESEPRLVRHGLVDKTTGHVLAQSVGAALVQRASSGEGTELSIAMLDVALSFFWPDAMMDRTAQTPEVRLPPASETFRLTPTADGALALVVLTETQWANLAAVVGFDPGVQRKGEVLRAVKALLATLSTDDAVRLLQQHDVACGPVVALDDVATQPQVIANDSLGLYEHPVIGKLRQPKPVPRFTPAEPARSRPAPLLGEHTVAVLEELGLPGDAIEELHRAGVVSLPVEPATTG